MVNRRDVLRAIPAAILGHPPEGGTDLQSRIDYTSANGGDPIPLPAGDVLVERSLILKPGVVLRGSRVGRTRFIASRPSLRVFDRHPGPEQGFGGLENLTVVGYGDRMNSRGDERDRTVVIGPFAKGWCRNVEVAHSRWVSLTGAGTEFEISGCYVHHGYRDGIQLNSVQTVKVEYNVIDRVADDAIACHVGKGFIPSPTRSILIANNRLSRCTGIKCLGASNAVIRNNSGSLVYGYGVFLGADTNFGEGLASERNIEVIDNTFLDTLGLTEIGAGRGVAVIYLAGGSAGLKGNDGQPIMHSDITISRNAMRQTLGGKVRRVDLWWVDGAFSKPLWTDRFGDGGSLMRGVMLDGGALDRITVEGNVIEGLAEPVLFQRNTLVTRSRVLGNKVSHCSGPIVAPLGVKVEV